MDRAAGIGRVRKEVIAGTIRPGASSEVDGAAFATF